MTQSTTHSIMQALAPAEPLSLAQLHAEPRAGHTAQPEQGTTTLDPAPASPATSTGLGIIDQLLRDRSAILARIQREVELTDLARTMILTIFVASAVFGAAVGMYRGGIQIAYAAIKFPLLMLGTAAISAPALSAFNSALDRPVSLRRDLALFLSALALGSLVLVAQAPLLLLASSLEFSYHSIILLTFACSGVAGLGSLIMVSRGVRAASPERTKSAVLGLLMVVCMVGAQMAWTFRPYVVRPRSPEVPFVRQIEGNLIESVMSSLDSARGIYHRDFAPLPGAASVERNEVW